MSSSFCLQNLVVLVLEQTKFFKLYLVTECLIPEQMFIKYPGYLHAGALSFHPFHSYNLFPIIYYLYISGGPTVVFLSIDHYIYINLEFRSAEFITKFLHPY